MNIVISIFLDNIIFALQKAGGISAYWSHIVKGIGNEPGFQCKFLDYNHHNIFRNELSINPENSIREKNQILPLQIQRFLNPNLKGEEGIYHSSYYRVASGKKIINITTVHDFTYESHRNGVAKWVHHRQKDQAIRNSKRLICVSDFTKTALLQYYPGLDAHNVRVIYNGVDQLFQPLSTVSEPDLKKLAGFSAGEYVIYVGARNNAYKNFKAVLNACKLNKRPLITVGGEPMTKQEDIHLSDSLGNSQYKHFSTLSVPDLNILYNHALCLLYPSVSEGFGIPVIEAQKAGCPVIGANRSAIPEVAGKGAILLDEISEHTLVEAIREVLTNRTGTDHLIKEGFKNAERFSWDKCYQQTKQVYNEVYEEYF